MTTVAGNIVVGGLYNGDGIPATDAGINYPTTVTIDPAGYILIGDNNRLIREVDPNGTVIWLSSPPFPPGPLTTWRVGP